MAVPGTDLGALGGLANPGFGALQPIPGTNMLNKFGGAPQAPPKGLIEANGFATAALVNWYNDQTGQRYTANSGGWSAEPGSGWRKVKSDSYDGRGKLVSQDPINMPGFVGPTYSEPSPAAPAAPAPTIPSLPSLVGTAPSGIPPVPTEVPATQTPSPGALPSTPYAPNRPPPPPVPAGIKAPDPFSATTSAMGEMYNPNTGQRYTTRSGGYSAEPGSGWVSQGQPGYVPYTTQTPSPGALPSTPYAPATPAAPNYGALPSTPIPPATPYAPNYGALPSTPYAPNYGALPSTSATPSVGSPTTGSGTKMGILDFLTEGAPIPAGSAPVAKTTTDTTPDWYTNYAKDLLSGQQQVSTTPYQTYQGPRIADFTATQRQGMGQTTDAAGLGAAPIRQGIGVAQQQIGQSGLSSAQPYLQQAGQASYGNIASYMNPYNEAVTSRIAELGARNLREQILPGINDQFISAGQAGSSRNAEMFSRAARDTNESIIAAQNAALQSGYSGALTASQADLARQGQLANIAGGLGTEGVRSGLDTAKTLADLGTSAQTSGLAGAAAVTGVGAAQQGLNQQNLTLAYQDFLRQQGYPQEQIDAALKTMAGIGATKAIPTAQTEVGIQPLAYPQQYAPSALSTGLGTIATGAGIAKDLSAVDWDELRRLFG